MGFKVASRVRGLSDEAFREAFGAEEQCRSALSRLRWPDGFVCPACGHRGHCVLAGRSLYQCYRCKKQTSSTAGHDLPRHQAAADAVVRGRPPDRNGEERDFLGRAGAPSRGQAADRLDHEAQDHGGDGAARGRHAAVGADGDGRCLPRRRARRRQAGPWRAGQDALRGGGLHQPRGPAAQGQAGPGQGLPQARDRARRQALAGPPEARSSPTACAAGTRSTGSSEAIARSAPAPGGRPPAWRPSNGSTRRSATSRARSPEPTASSAPIMPNATSPASPGDTTGATSSTP